MRPTTASSAEEGLKILHAAAQRDKYQLALLDVMMPEIDGIEMARRIRADPVLAKIPIIFVSSVGGRPDFSTRIAGLDAAGWLTKPVPQSTLYNVLVSVLTPMSEASAAKPDQPRAKSAQGFTLPTGMNPKVLLAEDKPINQKVAKLQLQKLGLQVDAVFNGREALEAQAAHPYDLIFMDCQMPELDGYEATRKLRQREGSGHRAIVIAMTAHALPGDREKCLAAGMDAYISKPVTQASLEAALRELFPPLSSAANDAAAPS